MVARSFDKDRVVDTGPVIVATVTGMSRLDAFNCVMIGETTAETLADEALENKPDYVPEGSTASAGRRNENRRLPRKCTPA